MERMKPNKIIAVDTSLGTNFLISACDDATVSELRGLIQMGHLSCFPEHGSIDVLALTVQYKQRQYYVTDSLLIGQICRKSWSNIHAEVLSGSLRAASTSHSSRSAEAESLANGKAGNGCAAPDGTLVAECAGSKGLDGQSNEALAHSSSPLLCVQKDSKVSCTEMIPIVSNSQASWLDHRCPLLSMEAPYTQSHSQINLATRAALSKEVSGKDRQCKKRKCAKDEIVGRKQNQGQIIHNFDQAEDSSPSKKSAINIKGDINLQDHKEFLLKGQQMAPMKEDTELVNALKEPPQAPMPGEAQVAEAHKEPKTNELQYVDTDNSLFRIQSKGPLSPHSEALVGSPAKLKPISSLSVRDFAAFGKGTTNKAPADTARIEGLSSAKMSTENQAEGMEDADLNNGAQVSKMDLSKGYPIQLNDHSTLFVASLSADVVPETQESQMQSQDGMNAEGEEVALEETGIDVYEHAACMEPHSNSPRQDPMACEEVGAQGLPPHQDARNMNPMDAHNDEENLALLAEKKETSNPKPSVAADAEKKDVGTLGAHTNKLDRQLRDTGLSGGNHDIPLVQKKKKRKRKKVSEIHKVSVQEDSRFIASGRSIPGNMESKKDVAHLLKNQTKTCNHEKEGERVIEGQAQTMSGNVDALNLDDAHLKELERQNGTTLSIEQCNLREPSCFAGEKRSGEKPIEGSLKGENCEAAMQGEVLSMKEGEVTQAGTTRRKKKRQNGTALSVDQGNHRESPCFSGEKRSGEKLIEGSLKGENCEATMQGEMLGMKDGEVTHVGTTRKKKKRRRKERPPPSPEGDLGDNPLNMGNEGVGVSFTIKELPNVLRLTAVKEGGELWSSTAKVVGEQVSKEGKEKATIESDPNISLMQEQDQDHATIDHANRKALLKDRRLVATSSTSSHTKECSQEGTPAKTQRGFDVFDFESSETGNRMKGNCKNNEVTSISEVNNLEKLCAAAVKLVEDEILSPSKTTTRKSSRKAVHPKRWITVLTERLTWNQTSKSNSKKQRANKRGKSIAEGASLLNNEELNSEPLYVEEEAKEERSQIILGDGRVACSNGCGKLYSKKTSAYYRHRRMCSGGDQGCRS